jgi:hypothetical protein
MRKIPENQFDQLFFDEDDEEVVMYEDEEYWTLIIPASDSNFVTILSSP